MGRSRSLPGPGRELRSLLLYHYHSQEGTVKHPRILLGDDHSLVLKGIRGLLEGHYDVVGVAEDGRALVEAALRLKPDVVVLDVSMPILNGIDAARAIKKGLPATRLVFLSMHSNAVYLRKALEAGRSEERRVGKGGRSSLA